jgi:translation initiation factor 1 (eIF-1/SUI1)
LTFIDRYKNNEITTEEAKELISNALKNDDLRILMKELSSQAKELSKDVSENYQQKNSRKFVCCVDGTQNGDITFHTMTHLMRKRDYIAILHSPVDGDAKGTTFEDPSGMKHHYESQLLRRGVPSGNILFQIEAKGNLNTLTILKRYMSLFHTHQKQKVNTASPTILDSSFVYEIPPDFIFLGDDSWKGQNTTNTTPSSSDLVMRTFHIPCIICKKRFSNLNQQLTTNGGTSAAVIEQMCYVMAIDDSQTSFNGLEILLQLLKSSDRLILVHVHYPLEAVPPQHLASTQCLHDDMSVVSTASPVLSIGGNVRQGGGLSQLLATTTASSQSKEESTDTGTSATVPALPVASLSSSRRPSHGNAPCTLNRHPIYS